MRTSQLFRGSPRGASELPRIQVQSDRAASEASRVKRARLSKLDSMSVKMEAW